MADRDLTHYDDVFDLLGLYYSNGWDHFSRAIDTWVGINPQLRMMRHGAHADLANALRRLEMPVPRFLTLYVAPSSWRPF